MKAKPSTLIRKHCKTDKQALRLCFRLIDWFCGPQEVSWAIECQNKERCAKKKYITT
jgi:hypothetical protein